MPPNPTNDSPTTPADRLTGSVLRITYSNPDNGYCVIKLRPDTNIPPQAQLAGGAVALVGPMPGVEVGQQIEAAGEWIRDPKFGPQFKVQWFKPMLPTGARGMEVYLGSGALKGIGPKTAERIVAALGDRTFDVLERDPDQLRQAGFSKKQIAKIAAGWKTATGDRELVTFLGENGIPPGTAARLRKVYGENALAVVRANPYQLMGEVRGIGFRRADDIARKLGLPADAPARVAAALHHVLENAADDGHTCLPRLELEQFATELLEQPPELIATQLDDALGRLRLLGEVIDGAPHIFLPHLRQAELRIAERLQLLIRAPKQLPRGDAVATLADFEQRTHFHLAAAQREAALTLARTGLLILTGGPGTGKTTTVRSIIELFTQARLRVKLAAPTGRAARRLSETSKMPAETIHRLLSYQAPLGKFGRNEENPVEADLVIVDEASMLDAPLAAVLLEALAPRTCLLLVGDEDQLPSVGPGNVLGDLIAAEALPLVRLTEVFRQAQASLIVTNAHRINRGEMPWLQPPVAVPGAPAATKVLEDFFFIERRTPDEIVATIKTLIRERIPRKFHLDPHHDIQVLTPMRKGELGVEALNIELKKLLNPDRGAQGTEQAEEADELKTHRRGALHSEGDRVMQVSNNYDKLVYNGDIGHVTHMNAETREVMVDFDGRQVSYLSDEMDQLTLAYATTIHKSQGSEYPAVIVPIHTTHWIMLQRNLIYTAITRARKLVLLIGERRALRRAIGNATRASRSTALRHFLKQSEHA
jgi:exodeoxyribonuclease V alpha subunit